jgi:hypothetical protein
MLRAMSYRLTAALMVCATLSLGCNALGIGPSTCSRPETDEPRPYKDGFIDGDTYMSAEWSEELLHFPGGAYYDIFHGLGERPNAVQFYLSFNEEGVAAQGGAGDSLTQAAGNQVELRFIDEEKLTVLNGTCAEYYLLVIARVDAPGGSGI